MKTATNLNNDTALINSFEGIQPNLPAQPVRVVNSWEEDFIYGKFPGRTTGLAAGYTSDISFNQFALVLPGNPTTYNFLPLAGVNDIRMRSTSAQDSSTGTGTYLQIVFLCDKDFNFTAELIPLSGTTSISFLTPFIYHIYYSFPVLSGSLYNGNNFTSNAGQLYIGRGTEVGGAGFTTNLAWNRIGDGFTSSSIYVVPKTKFASLWSVKYNADRNVPVIFRTFARPNRSSPWSLNSEDLCGETTVIQRSLVGGALSPGAEFTVLASKTEHSGTVNCNFVMTLHEFNEKIYRDVSGNAV